MCCHKSPAATLKLHIKKLPSKQPFRMGLNSSSHSVSLIYPFINSFTLGLFSGSYLYLSPYQIFSVLWLYFNISNVSIKSINLKDHAALAFRESQLLPSKATFGQHSRIHHLEISPQVIGLKQELALQFAGYVGVIFLIVLL